MNDYLKTVDQLEDILSRLKREDVILQIENAKSMGGTGGEILAIICSLLKTYEISNPVFFSLIRTPAKELYNYAQRLSLSPCANFDLLDELSKSNK